MSDFYYILAQYLAGLHRPILWLVPLVDAKAV